MVRNRWRVRTSNAFKSSSPAWAVPEQGKVSPGPGLAAWLRPSPVTLGKLPVPALSSGFPGWEWGGIRARGEDWESSKAALEKATEEALASWKC